MICVVIRINQLRLMGGNEVDFPLKKVIFSMPSSPIRSTRKVSFLPVKPRCFSGSNGCTSLPRPPHSFRGDSFRLGPLELETMSSLSFVSWVAGNKSKNSFFPVLVAVANLRGCSTGKESRFGSSLV